MLFWGVTQRIVVNICRRFETTYEFHLQGSHVKMGPTGCPETLVRNYHYSLRNTPEERNSYMSVQLFEMGHDTFLVCYGAQVSLLGKWWACQGDSVEPQCCEIASVPGSWAAWASNLEALLTYCKGQEYLKIHPTTSWPKRRVNPTDIILVASFLPYTSELCISCGLDFLLQFFQIITH